MSISVCRRSDSTVARENPLVDSIPYLEGNKASEGACSSSSLFFSITVTFTCDANANPHYWATIVFHL